MDSRFLLSHIRHYPLLQERSLDFARDDVAEAALSKHILYTGRGLSIPPIPSFRAQREIFLALCSFFLLSQKISPFPLSHIRHYPLLQERFLGFARDDVTEVAFSRHIRCTLREINPFPHRHFERSEKSSLHSALSCSFRKRFPLFRCHTYGAIPVCKKDPSAPLSMTLLGKHSPNMFFP